MAVFERPPSSLSPSPLNSAAVYLVDHKVHSFCRVTNETQCMSYAQYVMIRLGDFFLSCHIDQTCFSIRNSVIQFFFLLITYTRLLYKLIKEKGLSFNSSLCSRLRDMWSLVDVAADGLIIRNKITIFSSKSGQALSKKRLCKSVKKMPRKVEKHLTVNLRDCKKQK